MRPRPILAPLLAALLAAGCGLPSSYYLTPPATPGSVPGTGSAVPGTPVFYIISTTDNSESEFRGFELYYKCYLNEGDIESNFGSSSFESDLRSAGFLAVCPEGDFTPTSRTVPLFLIDDSDRGTDFVITIDFNPSGLGLYDAVCTFDPLIQASKGVRRHVLDTATGVSCKTFDFAEFLSTDADFLKIAGSVPANGPFYIAMYALSYGLQDISTPIWSYPVYLGYVGIHL